MYDHQVWKQRGAPIDQAGDEESERQEHTKPPEYEPCIELKRQRDMLKGVHYSDYCYDSPAEPAHRLETRHHVTVVVWQLRKCNRNWEMTATTMMAHLGNGRNIIAITALGLPKRARARRGFG